MAWTTISSNTTAQDGSSYFIVGNSTVNVNLPSLPNDGFSFKVYAAGSGGWNIPVSSSNLIRLTGSLSSSSGSCYSLTIGDCLELTFCQSTGYWESTQDFGSVSVS